MKKEMIVATILLIFLLISCNAISIPHQSIKNLRVRPSTNNKFISTLGDQPHIVLVEEATAQFCHNCPSVSENLYNIYKSGKYKFYFVALIADKNPTAYYRVKEDYNLFGYPTCFIDGGYRVIVGKEDKKNYENAIEECMNREDLADIDVNLKVTWKENAVMHISVTIKNNEKQSYDGYLRVYITEINSRWNDYDNNPYHFGFLDYAFNESISISKENEITKEITWDGKERGYGDINKDNIMVIASVFNGEKHTGYAYPPNGNPFDAYYVDATTAAKPEKEVKPSTLKGYVKNKDGEILSNVKITLKNSNYQNVTKTDANGYYEIKNIPPAVYNLKAEKIDYKTYNDRINMPEGKIVWKNITLLPEKIVITLKGYISDRRTKNPIEDVKITVSNELYIFDNNTDENGYYEISILPGTYNIKLEKEGYKTHTDIIEVGEGKNIYWYNESLQPTNLPPEIRIERPEKGRLYVGDVDVAPFIPNKILVIGKITISVSAFSDVGIKYVEFRIDNGPPIVDRKPPYERLWMYSALGTHTIHIKAYDSYGRSTEKTLEIIKIG
jgi:hypothetical protein